MKKGERVFQFGLRGFDTNLCVVLFFLMVFGFVMIYSASYYTASMSSTYNYDAMYLLKNQVIFSLGGIFFMVLVSSINYHVFAIFAIPGYILCLILIALLKTPFGVTVNGATRWVRIAGAQFQVAEPIKLLMIVFMATLIVVKGKGMRSWLSMIKLALPSIVVSVLVLKVSNNMSTAAILLGMTAIMIYVVHPEQLRFFVLILLVVAFVAAVIWYVKNLDAASLEENFRFARIRAWLEPYEYEQDTAYQSLQGLYAIGSGGLWGKGLGNSIQKLGTIPEPYNDYIFAIICEEIGVFGAGLIILLFLYLLHRIYDIAQESEDLLGRLIAIGVMSHIALQVILNMLVVTGLFPTTGVTLPFFSYGGSASFFLLLEIGLVLSVNKWNEQKRRNAVRKERL